MNVPTGKLRGIRFAVPNLFDETAPLEIVDHLAGAGFNAILCTVRPPFLDDQRLSELIEAAHSRGIRFHAVISTMVAGDVEPGGSPRRDPPTMAVDSAGRRSEEWLCATHPGVRGWVRALARSLAAAGCDGVQLDYIRFCAPDLCHCPRCRAESAGWLGDHPLATWDDWRDSAIASFIAEVRAVVKSVASEIEFSCSLWTAGAGQRRTYMTPEGEGYGWRQGQDFDRIASLADYVRPMLYSCMLREPGDWIVETTRLAVRNAAGRTRVVPGLALTIEEPWKKCQMPPEELAHVLNGLDHSGAAGVAVFSYQSLFAPNYRQLGYLDVVRRYFENSGW